MAKFGRPRTTVDDLPLSWRETIMSIAQEGGSDVEARCALGIGNSSWYTLLEDSEEFRETIKNAKSVCEVWWERQGRRLAVNGGGNATIWIFNMKNRFGWRDQPVDEGDDIGAPVSVTFNVKSPVSDINITKGKKTA